MNNKKRQLEKENEHFTYKRTTNWTMDTSSDDDDTVQNHFLIKAITNKLILSTQTFYLVQWINYPNKDTWEPECNVINTQALRNYKRKHEYDVIQKFMHYIQKDDILTSI